MSGLSKNYAKKSLPSRCPIYPGRPHRVFPAAHSLPTAAQNRLFLAQRDCTRMHVAIVPTLVNRAAFLPVPRKVSDSSKWRSPGSSPGGVTTQLPGITQVSRTAFRFAAHWLPSIFHCPPPLPSAAQGRAALPAAFVATRVDDG